LNSKSLRTSDAFYSSSLRREKACPVRFCEKGHNRPDKRDLANQVHAVLAAKEFLDAELSKYETYKSTDKFISSLFEDEHGFRRAKAGVGRDTILKFLGKNWKESRLFVESVMASHNPWP